MNRQLLLSTLEQVRPGLAKKEIVEQSNTFLFVDGTVTTFNDEICVQAPLPEDCADLEGAVNAQELHDLLHKVDQDEIEIKSLKKELRITGKGFKSGVRRQTVELVPQMGKPGKKKRLHKNLLDAIRACMFSVSDDASRPLLTCIHVAPDLVESCDNFRLTRFPLDTGVKKAVLIPGRYAEHLRNFPIRTLQTSEGWLHFRTRDGIVFSCRTYSEDYPDLSRLYPDKGTKVILPKKGITDLLESASVFIDAEHRLEAAVKLTFKPGKLKIRSDGASGWFEGRYKIKYKGPETTARLNPHMLREILKHSGKALLGEHAILFNTDTFSHVVSLFGEEDETEE